MLKIGVSACFFHADPLRAIFKGKTLLYLVEDVGNWLASQGALPCLIPTLPKNGGAFSFQDIVSELDALILQGGSDVAPQTYGETPLKPEWSGDAIRDRYEIALVQEFVKVCKPVLGLCRGLQLLNVAFKGTLYQDITTQVPGSLNHRNWDIYDQNFHQIEVVAGSKLEKLYGRGPFKVNSVHHQAIKDLGSGLQAEAISQGDCLVEAIRKTGTEYVVGVQWHPEFQDPQDRSILATKPLLDEFLQEARARKEA